MNTDRRRTPAAGVTEPVSSFLRSLEFLRPSLRKRGLEAGVVMCFAALPLGSTLQAQDFSALDPAAGKALFERNWVPAPSSTAASDGLGPHFNARSCAACHEEGGAGAIELSRMNLLTDDPVLGAMLQLRAVPGLPAEVRAELGYGVTTHVTLRDGTTVELLQPELALASNLDDAGLLARTSLRRAPGLHGLAALDRIPPDALHARADPDDRDGDGISGRVADDDGRFGWRADAATLRAQVARALSLDLGLGSPLLPSAAGDCTPRQQACLDAARSQTGDVVEAPDVVLDLLIAYLSALPLPSAPPADAEGAGIFLALGCAGCHTPQPDPAQPRVQAYTDLLLHDLGAGLASAGASEWRTAPLWALSERARLLHDGRARSIDEAVLWHGGEASASAKAYGELNRERRELLRAWLLGL